MLTQRVGYNRFLYDLPTKNKLARKYLSKTTMRKRPFRLRIWLN